MHPVKNGEITLAQDRDRDQGKDQTRDQDRNRYHLSDADMNQLRLMLRDGTCEDVSNISAADIDNALQCLDQHRVRDGSCNDTIRVDGASLALLLLKCLDASTN